MSQSSAVSAPASVAESAGPVERMEKQSTRTGFSAYLSQSRDQFKTLGRLLYPEEFVKVRDLLVRDRDGRTISKYFPIDEAVIEYRHSIGSEPIVRRTNDSESEFICGHKACHASLGIPESAYERITENCGQFDCPELDYHEGYYWLPVEVPSELPFAMNVEAGQVVRRLNLWDFMKAHKMSVHGVVGVAVLLKSVYSADSATLKSCKLAMRIQWFKYRGCTRRSSPPVNAHPSAIATESDVKSELIEEPENLNVRTEDQAVDERTVNNSDPEPINEPIRPNDDADTLVLVRLPPTLLSLPKAKESGKVPCLYIDASNQKSHVTVLDEGQLATLRNSGDICLDTRQPTAISTSG